jgi:transcriptional regulator with XRE-family HTH domain
MIENIPTKELANFLGVSLGFVSNIKAGRKRLPPEYMSSVSERFDISLDDLAKHYQKHKAKKSK